MKGTILILLAIGALMVGALWIDRAAEQGSLAATQPKAPAEAAEQIRRPSPEGYKDLRDDGSGPAFRLGLANFKRGRYEEARKLFLEFQETADPVMRERASVYLEACRRELAAAEAPALEVASPEEAPAMADQAEQQKDGEVAEAPAKPTLEQAREHFDQQAFPEAREALRSIQRSSTNRADRRAAGRMLATLQRFLPVHEAGRRAYSAQDFAAAVEPLERAKQLCLQISPGGPLRQALAHDLEKAHFLLGQTAYEARDYPAAFDHWNRAVEADPKSRRALDGLMDVHQKAMDFYLEAFMDRQGDPVRARFLYEQVVKMTPVGDEYRAKAKMQLRALRRR